MNVTIYRGAREIGGTLIEVKSLKCRILLDAGYPLFLDGSPIDRYIADLPEKSLLELGVLPAVQGLYKWDIPKIDAIIVSHAHLDHYGLLPYVHPNIPVYLSSGTNRLMEISRVFKITKSFQSTVMLFTMYQPFTIGDITIMPFLMDHSAFDAAAFELKTEEKTVIYTGDFRGHGRKAVCLERFVTNATKQTDLLLTEGTMLGRLDEEVLTEEDLEAKARECMVDSRGITLFQASSQNIDRLVSFYRAARSARKLFVVDVYTANVLYELRQLGNRLPYPSADYPDIKVFFPYRLTKRIFNEYGEVYAKRFSPFYISKESIQEKQWDIVMAVRPSMMTDLKRCCLAGGTFIYSMWQGYRSSDYQAQFESWLTDTHFTCIALHTSGHAKQEDIRTVINDLNPRMIVPVHTMNPEMFLGISDNVRLAVDGEEIDI